MCSLHHARSKYHTHACNRRGRKTKLGEEKDIMEQEVALKPLCRGGFVSTERSGVRYIHMFSFSSVEALRIFLEEHPETRNANLHLASEEYVQCYANFIFRQEHNAEDLDEIFSYALRGECLPPFAIFSRRLRLLR